MSDPQKCHTDECNNPKDCCTSAFKLHNFCIDTDNGNSDTYIASDEWLIELNGDVPLVATTRICNQGMMRSSPSNYSMADTILMILGVLSVGTTGSAATTT